ncbi:hypothetical protein [Streptomyces sp. NPDC055210]
MRYEDELAIGPTALVALTAGTLVSLWLRARNVYSVLAVNGTLLATLAGAWILDGGYASKASPYLALDGTWSVYLASQLAVGATLTFAAITWGTVSGYRHPRPKEEPEQA